MGMIVEALTRLVTTGELKAMKTPSGETVVLESETEATITKEQFEHLRGRPITMAEASRMYGPTIKAIWERVQRKRLFFRYPAAKVRTATVVAS